MAETGGGARLSDLESRWRFDRSPRVFLQLADELRRTGAFARAIEVLSEGLSHHPESVSGRVALGRAQLEAGDATAAAETLERVLARDPAQIVASKLLIEAWIRMGDAARARERLDIYRILQERDAEIEEYDRRIASMERSERLAAVIELAGADPAPAADGDGAREEGAASGINPGASSPVSEPLFDLAAPREFPRLDLRPAVEPPSRRFAANARRSAGRPAGGLDPLSPFGTLHDPSAGGARILAFFRAQALFLPPGRSAATIEPSGVPGEAAFVPAPDRRRPETVGALEPIERLDAAVRPEAEAAVFDSEPASELDTGRTFERFSTTGFAAEVEAETQVESFALEAPPSANAVEIPVSSVEKVFEERVVERWAPAAAAPDVPSATLARLYLEQGHLLEAEEEYRRVLESRPDDQVATEGLHEVARRRVGDETVSSWGPAAPVVPRPQRPLRTLGLTQRKVETLRDYLERLRRARARVNVS